MSSAVKMFRDIDDGTDLASSLSSPIVSPVQKKSVQPVGFGSSIDILSRSLSEETRRTAELQQYVQELQSRLNSPLFSMESSTSRSTPVPSSQRPRSVAQPLHKLKHPRAESPRPPRPLASPPSNPPSSPKGQSNLLYSPSPAAVKALAVLSADSRQIAAREQVSVIRIPGTSENDVVQVEKREKDIRERERERERERQREKVREHERDTEKREKDNKERLSRDLRQGQNRETALDRELQAFKGERLAPSVSAPSPPGPSHEELERRIADRDAMLQKQRDYITVLENSLKSYAKPGEETDALTAAKTRFLLSQSQKSAEELTKELNITRETTSSKIEQLQKQVETYCGSERSLLNQVKELATSLEEATRTAESAKTDLQTCEANLERERSKNRNLASVVKDVTEQNEDFIRGQQKEKNELAELAHVTRESKAQEQKLSQLVDLQWKQLEEKADALANVQRQNAKLSKELTTLKSDMETLQDELKDAKSEMEILRASEKQRIQLTNRENKALMARYKEETEKWRNLVKSRNTAIKKLKADLAQNAPEKADLERQAIEAESRVAALREELKALSYAHEQVGQSLAEQQLMLKKSQQHHTLEVQRVNADKAQLQVQLRQMEMKLAQFEKRSVISMSNSSANRDLPPSVRDSARKPSPSSTKKYSVAPSRPVRVDVPESQKDPSRKLAHDRVVAALNRSVSSSMKTREVEWRDDDLGTSDAHEDGEMGVDGLSDHEPAVHDGDYEFGDIGDEDGDISFQPSPHVDSSFRHSGKREKDRVTRDLRAELNSNGEEAGGDAAVDSGDLGAKIAALRRELNIR